MAKQDKKILIVDDSAVQAQILKRALEKASYAVDSAADGVAALEKLKKVTVDLIISDTLMPKMDGFQLCRECKSDDKLRKIPIILTSASYIDKSSEEFALKVGADRFLLKSADLKSLVKAIEELIQEYREKPPGELKKPAAMDGSIVREHERILMTKLEEQMQSLQEAQSLGRIGNWEYDVKSRGIKWSDEVFVLYGRDPALGPPSEEEEAKYYTPEQAKTLRDYAARAIKNGEELKYDIEANLPGGKKVFFSATMRPIKNESGQVVKLVGTVQDITERKRAEETLKERVKELKCIAEISKLAEKPGISIEEFVKQSAALLPSAWQYPEDACARITLDGAVFRTENFKESVWSQSADLHVDGQKIGRVTVGYLKEKPAADEGPFIKEERELINVVADFLSHIIQHRRTEKAIRESEAKWRSLAANAPDIIINVDRAGKILFINRTVAGFTVEGTIGKSIYDFTAPENHEVIKGTIEKVFSTGEMAAYETGGAGAEGRMVWYSTRVGPIKSDGGVVSAILVSTDITERKQSEEEHNKHIAELEILAKAATGRELKMMELEKEVNKLLKEMGKEPKYRGQS